MSEKRMDHFEGLEEGAGCTEIWEKMSERRRSEEGKVKPGTGEMR